MLAARNVLLLLVAGSFLVSLVLALPQDKDVAINNPCFFNEQCENLVFQTECRDDVCACRFERTPVFQTDGTVQCIAKNNSNSEPYTDPAMLCVLAGMCLMFIIICVVLRLFSK
ncbi:PREDICTED: uncharacterized protein LOC107168198 [Diuraphis noxia]|uniref:uncharacterized protein LOC107168198 n=1 Tax=Diuraphis noxia TaxID=143948 RepID=UPI0007639E75|nr:PREDICTED: uncharacterized protein LOC107168198 [Diuraphis noxia]